MEFYFELSVGTCSDHSKHFFKCMVIDNKSKSLIILIDKLPDPCVLIGFISNIISNKFFSVT